MFYFQTERERDNRTPPATGFDRKLLVPMILGSILNPINSSIIAVALIPIAVAFGAPTAQTTWLVSALYIATAIGQPLVGRLVDLFGPRKLYLIGTALTGVAGIIGLLAPSLHLLIVARIVLGFGTCAGYPASMYLIRAEAKRTGLASPAGVLTALAVATQTVQVIGPTLGGLLINLGGWRSTFVVNIPLSLACVILGAIILPRHTALDAEQRAGASPHLDPIGIVLFAGALVALLVFLMDLHVGYLWLLALALVAGAAFVWWELRESRHWLPPFIDLRVFVGNRPLIVTYIRSMLASVVSYAFMYGFTQWLEDGRGLDPSHAGLLLLPSFGVGIVVSLVTGHRPEIRAKLLVGSAFQVVACLLIILVADDSAIAFLLAVSLLMGVPQGLISLASQNALYHQADPERIGASSGLLRTFNYLGAIIAAAASGLFFPVRATTAGVHQLGLVTVICAGVCLVITIVDRSLGRVDRQLRRQGA